MRITEPGFGSICSSAKVLVRGSRKAEPRLKFRTLLAGIGSVVVGMTQRRAKLLRGKGTRNKETGFNLWKVLEITYKR